VANVKLHEFIGANRDERGLVSGRLLGIRDVIDRRAAAGAQPISSGKANPKLVTPN
jgi:hypothetical protein